MKKLRGFTLTELMIALVVLGILVAVVAPAIMKTRPNKNKMMVKKAYYIAEGVVSDLINNPELYPDNSGNCCGAATDPKYGGDITKFNACINNISADNPCAWGFDDMRLISHNGSTSTNTYGNPKVTLNYSGQNKFRLLFADNLNVKSSVATIANGLTYVTTNDGITWIFDGRNGWPSGSDWTVQWDQTGYPNHSLTDAGTRVILVDVNGYDSANPTQNGPNGCQNASSNASGNILTNGPQCMTAAAQGNDFDQFRIIVYPDGRLQIHHDDTLASEYVTLSTSVRN